jgi:hypothetical protein
MNYRFLNPFTITEKIKIRTFKLYLTLIYQRFYPVFYISLLKFYRRKTGVEPPFPSLIKINGEEKWEIKKILNVKIRYKKVKFKVR